MCSSFFVASSLSRDNAIDFHVFRIKTPYRKWQPIKWNHRNEREYATSQVRLLYTQYQSSIFWADSERESGKNGVVTEILTVYLAVIVVVSILWLKFLRPVSRCVCDVAKTPSNCLLCRTSLSAKFQTNWKMCHQMVCAPSRIHFR